MFQGRIFTQTGYGGRCVRFADQKTRGGVATTAYSFAMNSDEREEMARRITAALNLTRHLTTEQMEQMKAVLPCEQEERFASNNNGQLSKQQVDAERWNALINCARIRPLGSAGLSGSSHDPNGVEWGNRAHLGLELWTIHSPVTDLLPDERKVGVDWLTKFADKAILANKENTNDSD